ncbi:MAG: methionyl-tRNA formyltransferase [Chthonomonadales bacterium]|nr:methionyl-tRNA formyltransferase [Chthonomonadales bacterium]
MRILLAGNKRRGALCLERLAAEGHTVVGVVTHPVGHSAEVVAQVARDLGAPLFRPAWIGDTASIAGLRSTAPDLLVLAGYGQILPREVIDLAPRGCVNLHAGRLPAYRGSSPLNWAILNGDSAVGLSIIAVDEGVDTGEVLAETEIEVGSDETIAELTERADPAFAEMLAGLVRRIEAGPVSGRRQDSARAAYYPLRFPEDGLILWDQLTAREAHNRVRALTRPFPCAFTYWRGRRVSLVRTRMARDRRLGEPGRVYLANATGVLVCASDRCLWVTEARFDDGADALPAIARYETLATVRGAAAAALMGVMARCA